MSLDLVRGAFADALRTITGLNADGYLEDMVRPPHAMVDCSIDYDMTMARGADTYQFVVLVYGQRQNAEQTQKFFDKLRDPSDTESLKQVLEGDANLAALVQYVRVRTVGRPQVVTSATADYLMIEAEVEVCI